MSLSGKVEDLPLLEILQVVAFCQKTGHLTVRTPEGEAAVVFRDGRVVAGFTWDVPSLPAQSPSSSSEDRQEQMRRRITATLERLVRLREGEFGFNVSGSVPTRLGGRDLAAEMLEDGINPEGLMLDLARKMDEDRRDTAAALGASFVASSPSAPEEDEEELEELHLQPAAEEPSKGPLVLLVDDEPDVRRFVGERLGEHGFEVVTAADVSTAQRTATRLTQEGRRFVLVSDLGLPSAGGTTFRGGFDVVRHASGLEPRPRVLLMVDGADEKLRARARRLGVSFVAFKPGLSKLDPLQYTADLRAFGDRLARDLLPRLLRRSVTRPAPPLPLELPLTDDAAARAAALQTAIEELDRQPEPDLVAFLLLRAARAFLPRAILFLVRDDRLFGLSGFGATEGEPSLDLRARALSVGLHDPSPFADAVACGRAWTGEAPEEGPVRHLLDEIGSLNAATATVVPVRAHGETVAVLYGDAPDAQPLPDLSGLVDFAERAGRALDEALLARRAGDTAA
jgi:CheY-like chemotaxis protein